MVAEKAATARITGSQRSCNPYDEALVVEDPADNPHILLEKGDRESFASVWLDLVYYHEKSLDEVAEIVGIPVNTAKTRTFYARNHMERILKQAGVDAL